MDHRRECNSEIWIDVYHIVELLTPISPRSQEPGDQRVSQGEKYNRPGFDCFSGECGAKSGPQETCGRVSYRKE
jgi:hypothetical protein